MERKQRKIAFTVRYRLFRRRLLPGIPDPLIYQVPWLVLPRPLAQGTKSFRQMERPRDRENCTGNNKAIRQTKGSRGMNRTVQNHPLFCL